MVKKFGLAIVLAVLFAMSLIGQFQTGFSAYNDERVKENLPPLETSLEYAKSGHFISATSENMESEFLQMALFVFLTMFLYHQGSAESKKLPEEQTPEDLATDAAEHEYCLARRKTHPVLWRLYENSLTVSMAALFVVFFLIHAYGSAQLISEERVTSGLTPVSYWEVFSEREFWFESFQNWQSEFFSILMVGLLSMFLRQKGSPQSKKMFDSHLKTGP
jgi:hypothetical protein